MSDAKPNYHVEQQRLKAQIAAQRANIERQRLEIMEMEDRRNRYEENITSSFKAIKKCEQNLAQLIEAHGNDKEVSHG